jgi:nitrate/nitrite-specific signal transduction histidine kinase
MNASTTSLSRLNQSDGVRAGSITFSSILRASALRNGLRHSCAGRIEVEIHYDPRRFRLRVRDNGRGIAHDVLKGGRAGHYGQASMHERAKLVGGKLAVWSELDSGTEAELTIPASIAYAKSQVARRSMFWRQSA